MVGGVVTLDPNVAIYEIQWEGRWVPVLQIVFANSGAALSAIAYDKQSQDAPWGTFTAPDAALATLRKRVEH